MLIGENLVSREFLEWNSYEIHYFSLRSSIIESLPKLNGDYVIKISLLFFFNLEKDSWYSWMRRVLWNTIRNKWVTWKILGAVHFVCLLFLQWLPTCSSSILCIPIGNVNSLWISLQNLGWCSSAEGGRQSQHSLCACLSLWDQGLPSFIQLG